MSNELLPPPRRIPFSVKVKCLFTGFRYQISVLFLASAIAFFLVFAFDYPSLLFYKGAIEKTTGTLVDKQKTIFSTGRTNFGSAMGRPGQPIYKYFYVYSLKDKPYKASSVAIDRPIDKETPLVIEYLKERPSISRIQDMSPGRHLTGGVTPIVVIIVIILIAFLAVYSMTAKKIRLIHLLKNGLTATGTVKSKNLLSRSSGREWYEVTYEFTVDGHCYQVKDRPYYTERVEIGERRTLLYDRKKPHKAALLDNVSCSIVFDESGGIMSDSPRSTIITLLIPVASITLIMLSIYFEVS